VCVWQKRQAEAGRTTRVRRLERVMAARASRSRDSLANAPPPFHAHTPCRTPAAPPLPPPHTHSSQRQGTPPAASTPTHQAQHTAHTTQRAPRG
jgi:hypothetical protein